jgi:tellurite resistance protein
MTNKNDFSPSDWKLVLEGPPSAGLVVITADRGGTIRETFSMARAYADARQQHGHSELLDEIVAAKPEIDRSTSSSPEELKQRNLSHVTEAIRVLEGKVSPQELEDYRSFVLALAEKVASAHREGGEDGPISEAERAAIAEIANALGASPG